MKGQVQAICSQVASYVFLVQATESRRLTSHLPTTNGLLERLPRTRQGFLSTQSRHEGEDPYNTSSTAQGGGGSFKDRKL